MQIKLILTQHNELPQGHMPYLVLTTGTLDGEEYFLAYQISASTATEASQKAAKCEEDTSLDYETQGMQHSYRILHVVPFTIKLYFAFFSGCQIQNKELVDKLYELSKEE